MALSATIGTGNIVGVSAAILAGGPGAVSWMWVTAAVGMATKFTSCTLAVHFRRIDETGETHCGPMHFIELGMGTRFKWLAVLFAVFTVGASSGIGNMFQINNMVASLRTLLFGHNVADTFAFSTLVSWSYYGDRGADYLFGKRFVVWYRFLYCIVIVIGSCITINTVIDFSDVMNGLMALPNLVALVALSSVVVRLTKQYFANEGRAKMT